MNHILRSLSQQSPHAARIVLGLVFFVFGLNGFFHFLPQPPLPDAALPFISGLASSGYTFPVLKSIEVVAGVMLLSSFMVPLALTLLAPIIVNIALFHVFLVPGIPMVALLLGLELYLAWSYRAAFLPMLKLHVAPTAPLAARSGPAPSAPAFSPDQPAHPAG
jgi:uncharacterized membrane protein YphA (DoxX/SURF4 family)